MSAFIKALAALPTDWEVPTATPLTDAEWRRAFDSGDVQARKNLALGWLWTLHNEVQSVHESKRAQRAACLIEEHAFWFREIAPYIDQAKAQQAELVLDGSFERIYETLAHREEWYGGKQGHLAADQLRAAWLGNRDEQYAALIPLSSHIVGMLNAMDEETTPGPIVSLATKALWLTLLAAPKEDPVEKLRVVLTIVKCATRGLDIPRNTAPEHAAWHAFVQRISHPTTLSKTQYDRCAVEQTLAACPVQILPAIYLALHDGVLNEQGSTWLKSPDNPLFKETSSKTDIFSLLRQRVPQYNALWDTAEALEMPMESVVIDVFLGKYDNVSPAATLPNDIAPESALGL